MSTLILTYHGVERRPGPLFVDRSLFVEHLDVIAASGCRVLTVAELVDSLRASRLPDRAVALTFDDGFRSVAEEAAPSLLERRFRATIYCVAGRLGRVNDWPSSRPGAPRAQLADAGELAALAAAGFDIGSHGMEHAPFRSTASDTIRREVVDSKARLEQEVGVVVRSCAYPYGATPSAEARRAVAESYAAGCTTRIGRVSWKSDPLFLPRVDAHYLRSPTLLEAVLAGHRDAYLGLRAAAASVRIRLRRDYVARGRGA